MIDNEGLNSCHIVLNLIFLQQLTALVETSSSTMDILDVLQDISILLFDISSSKTPNLDLEQVLSVSKTPILDLGLVLSTSKISMSVSCSVIDVLRFSTSSYK